MEVEKEPTPNWEFVSIYSKKPEVQTPNSIQTKQSVHTFHWNSAHSPKPFGVQRSNSSDGFAAEPPAGRGARRDPAGAASRGKRSSKGEVGYSTFEQRMIWAYQFKQQLCLNKSMFLGYIIISHWAVLQQFRGVLPKVMTPHQIQVHLLLRNWG